jgi:hypothetical protein
MFQEIYSDEPFHALHNLLRAWCDRRCLEALSLILPAYLPFNGLTEAWSRLYDALNNLRASARQELTDEEAEEVDSLIGLARRTISSEVSLRAHHARTGEEVALQSAAGSSVPTSVHATA